MNILSVFERFENEKLISDYQLQEYMGLYNDIRDYFKSLTKEKEKVDITDDVVFEPELVKQFEVNIDYILMLLEKYKGTKDATIIPTVKKLIASSFELRSKKVLIEAFIDNIDACDDISKEWSEFVRQKAVEELNEIIAAHNLKSEETFNLIEFSLENETMSFNGTKLDAIMPPISIFGGRAKKKQLLLERLTEYYDKYSGIVIFLRGDNYA